MSIARLVFPTLHWAELWEILSYLTINEVYVLGCTCRSAFVTFLREKDVRKGVYPSLKAPPRFLGRSFDHDKVLLVSYPRCGNSYARKLLESSTGLVTGSDSRPNRPLSSSLIRFGYVGEGITDQSVWVVKSHFPERLGFIRFPVKRIILVIRNPFDAIESYFHMGMTNTHDKSLSPEAFASLKDIWNAFVPNEAQVWTKFYLYWLEQSKQLPIMMVRYEDILQDEKMWVQRMVAFLESGNPPLAHRWKTHWNEYMSNAVRPVDGAGYKPKKIVIGKALANVLTKEQAETIRELTSAVCNLFGYELTPASPEGNATTEATNVASHYYSLQLSPVRIPTPMLPPSDSGSTISINQSMEIRDDSDPYGRKITDLRRIYTKNDTEPFATK